MQFLSLSEQLTRILQCLFGSDRSPRRGNVVCACVCVSMRVSGRASLCVSVHDIIHKNIEKELKQHS